MRVKTSEVAYPDPKQPDAVLVYVFNWSEWLQSKSISSAAIEADEGITVDEESVTTSTHVVRVSGGEDNNTYQFASVMTDTNSETTRQVVALRVRAVGSL